MSEAQRLFDAAFHESKCRDPRSPEYKSGVLACLQYKLDDSTHMRCPYPMGTSQADAWLSGANEGLWLFNNREKRGSRA